MTTRSYSQVNAAETSIGTTYDTAKAHTHVLPLPGSETYCHVGVVSVYLEDIAGASSIFVKVCADSDLDFAVVTETEAPITIGTTGSANGTAQIYFGGGVKNGLGTSNTYYLAIRTDAGTVSMTTSVINWEV